VETVGVGQDEVDVVRSVDTVAVVVIPGMGDEIQAVKAGLLEIADVFVLNKADRDGAERAYDDLMFMLRSAQGDDLEGPEGDGPEGGRRTEPWTPPVVRTVARTGEGIAELRRALEEHRRWLGRDGRLAARRRQRLGLRVEEVLKRRVLAAANRADRLEREVDRALAEGADPYRAADRLFGELAPGEGDEEDVS
jgi:LAO/AO transport system kinase